jgi:proteasome lid subunit RPN8/RPN11
MEPLVLPSRIHQELAAHAVRALPAEAVGLLAGKAGRVELALPLSNIAPIGAFFADPFNQYRAEREIKSRELQVLGIYHSHPGGCACLSQRDLQFGREWACTQLVLSIDPEVGRLLDLKGYRIVHGIPREIEILR